MSYYEHIDFNLVDDHDLLDFIENRQHAFTRNLLDLIILNLKSAMRSNPDELEKLGNIVRLLQTIRTKSEYLINLQETRLFPFLRKLIELNQRRQPIRFLSIKITDSTIRQIREEHYQIRQMLVVMKQLTGQFKTPPRSDEVMKLCYAELKEFCEDLSRQLQRDDQFLLPRIASMETLVLSRSESIDAIAYGHGGDA